MAEDMDLRKGLPYRWYFISDYSQESSLIFYLISHAYTDGVSFYPMMTAMTVEKDFSQQYKVGELPLWKTIYNDMMLPITFVQLAWTYLTLPINYNCINSPSEGPSDDRQVRLSTEMSFSKFKKGCKRYKMSMNEACKALIGKSTRQYFEL